jgi:hypothetical protein
VIRYRADGVAVLAQRPARAWSAHAVSTMGMVGAPRSRARADAAPSSCRRGAGALCFKLALFCFCFCFLATTSTATTAGGEGLPQSLLLLNEASRSKDDVLATPTTAPPPSVANAFTLVDAFTLIQEQGRQIAELQALQLVSTRPPCPPAPPPLPPAAPTPGLFVVTAFGADPSGQRDSTQAVQQAFYNATAQMAAHDGPHGFGTGVVFEPEVRFPAGHYKISDTINLSNVRPSDLGQKDCGALGNDTTWCYFTLLRVTGEGLATVEQLDESRDVFAGAVVARLTFSFMNLRGGRNQLNVGNNNTDQGFIKVNDCTFEHATAAAIKIVGPSCQGCPVGVDDCPNTTCPPDPNPQTGSYSSQVIVTDCVFSRNFQTLIVWSDWAVLRDSWISTSCNLTDGAVIENHDKLFISNILGVPCNRRGNASKQRWIDNYSHRIDGGTVHVRNFRFGGESTGLPALVNFAPYACREVIQKPDLETEMCGRMKRAGSQVQGGVRGSGGSSILIEGSVFSSHASHDIMLEEVPSLLVLRDNWNNNAAADGLHQKCQQPGKGPCYKMVGVPKELDLDGPYMDVANQRGIRARPVFKIETMWNPPSVHLATEPADVGPAAVFDLPQQLQPFQEGRVEGVAPSSRLGSPGTVLGAQAIFAIVDPYGEHFLGPDNIHWGPDRERRCRATFGGRVAGWEYGLQPQGVGRQRVDGVAAGGLGLRHARPAGGLGKSLADPGR